MPSLKSEKHHWWPRCVSNHWVADDGKVARIDPTGRIVRSNPENFGVISNGHHIKLDHANDQPTVWDTSFEREFDRADGGFPGLIEWLSSLVHPHNARHGRFAEQPAEDHQITTLTESVVSLVVRSPRNREASVGLAEHFRGALPTKERNALIALNMQRKQRMIADSIGHRGKFAVLISRDRELIFGDGFFHNLNAVTNPPYSPKILVPLTPTIAVAVTRPMSFRTDPRLVSLVLEPEEVDSINQSIQVYSKSEVFFRSEEPTLGNAFRAGQHAEFSHPDNPIDTLLRSLPGVPDRNRSLDGIF